LLTYEIHNITGFSPECIITHGLDHDLTLNDSTGKTLPRFTSVMVGETPYDGEALSRYVDSDYRFTMPTRFLKADRPLSVAIAAASIIRVPDTWNWNMSNLAEGATIEIVVKAPAETGIAFTVKALHPERTVLKPKDDNGKDGTCRWEFEPALLPWQGFEFTSFLR